MQNQEKPNQKIAQVIQIELKPTATIHLKNNQSLTCNKYNMSNFGVWALGKIEDYTGSSQEQLVFVPFEAFNYMVIDSKEVATQNHADNAGFDSQTDSQTNSKMG